MRRLLALTLCAALALATGCAYAVTQTAQGEEAYDLYFQNRDLESAIGADAIGVEPSTLLRDDSRSTAELAEELVGQLLSGPVSETLKSPFPSGTALLQMKVSGAHAQVDLSASYRLLSGVALTVADYCITLTLTQLPGIRSVSITVGGQPLAYRSTQIFTARDVLLSSTEDVVGTVDVTLYFLNASGVLVGEVRTLELYEGDTQAESLVEALGKGPQEKEHTPTLPEGFAVQTVWVEEDRCYVNLSSTMLGALPEGAQLRPAILALASSLLTLESVKEVQFLVDGEIVDDCGGVDISRLFLPETM